MASCIQYVRLYCSGGSTYKADVVLSKNDGSVPDTFTALSATVSTCNPFCGTVAIPAGGSVCPGGGTMVVSDNPSGLCGPPPGTTYTCLAGTCTPDGDAGEYATLADCEADGCGASIARTDITTGQDTNSTSANLVLTFPGVTINAGERLIVGVGAVAASLGAAAVTFSFAGTSHAGTSQTVGGLGALGKLYEFTVKPAVNTTGSVVITMGDGSVAFKWLAAVLLDISGLAGSAVDKTAKAGGAASGPDSGSTATTAHADEYWQGFALLIDTDGVTPVDAGTWQHSFSDGNTVTQTGLGLFALRDGYRIVSATATAQASLAGTTPNQWAAMVNTFQ